MLPRESLRKVFALVHVPVAMQYHRPFGLFSFLRLFPPDEDDVDCLGTSSSILTPKEYINDLLAEGGGIADLFHPSGHSKADCASQMTSCDNTGSNRESELLLLDPLPSRSVTIVSLKGAGLPSSPACSPPTEEEFAASGTGGGTAAAIRLALEAAVFIFTKEDGLQVLGLLLLAVVASMWVMSERWRGEGPPVSHCVFVRRS